MAKVEIFLRPIPWDCQVLMPLGLILLDVLEHGTRNMGTIALPKDSYKDRIFVHRTLQNLIDKAERRAIYENRGNRK